MLTIKVEGMDELRRTMRAPSEEIAKQNRALMHRAVILVAQEARKRVQTRDGKAARGIRGDVIGAGATLKGIVRPRSKAAIFSQRTRRPGRTAPPVRAISRWLERIGNGKPTKAQAFLVARAIARKGHQGKPVMVASLKAKKPQIIALWGDRIKAAMRRKG